MSDTREKTNLSAAKAKIVWLSDAELRRHYTEDAGNRSGDELLEHYLTKLEIVASHLATMSYGLPNLTTVQKCNFTVAIKFYVAAMEELVARKESPSYGVIASIWPSVKSLFAAICVYRGEHQTLHESIWLGHRGAKIIVEVWRASKPPPQPSFYYAPEEESFARSLRFPITTSMSVEERMTALRANIEHLRREFDK